MRHWSVSLGQRSLWGAAAIALAAEAAGAQQIATLRGVVADRSSGKAIAAARILVPASSRSVTADESGHYSISLPEGANRLVVRAFGFPQLQLDVEIVAGVITDRRIELDSTAAGQLSAAQPLPTMSVTAAANPANYRLTDFERRRQLGRGQYMTEAEIAKSGAYNVADAVKNMRGVIYECGGGSGCYVRMARAPMRCLPEFIVDGQVMNDFGPVTPIRDIIGLEVYTGPTEVPGEYAGRYAGCGVVVIWTRSGPPKKR
jgi:carboxypeptidase family protein